MNSRVRKIALVLGAYLSLGGCFFYLGTLSGASAGRGERDATGKTPSPASTSASRTAASTSSAAKRSTRTIDLSRTDSLDEGLAPLDRTSLDTLLSEISLVFRDGGIDEHVIAKAWGLMKHLGPGDLDSAMQFAEQLEGSQGELMMLFLLPRMAAFDGGKAVGLVPEKLSGQVEMVGLMTVFASWSSTHPVEAIDWFLGSREDETSEMRSFAASPMGEEILPMLFGRLAIEDPAGALSGTVSSGIA